MPNAPWHRQIAASNSAANFIALASSRSKVARRGASAPRDLDEALGDVDAVGRDSPPGELVGVPAGSAPDVEHPHSGCHPEHRGHVVDLLPCALRVRVAQVRLTEVVGDRLEPVLTHRPPAASR